MTRLLPAGAPWISLLCVKQSVLSPLMLDTDISSYIIKKRPKSLLERFQSTRNGAESLS